MNTILEELRQKIAPERVLTKEPMKKHTTFRIGGEAELYIIPETIEEVQWTVKTARNTKFPCYSGKRKQSAGRGPGNRRHCPPDL